MLFKISLLIISLLSIAQVWYQSKLISIFAKPVLKVGDYQAFADEFKSLALWIGLLLLCSIFLFIKKTDDKPAAPSGLPWLVSFVLAVGLALGLALAVNPDGRFPWNERETYITIAAHSLKPNLYSKLKTTPEVLIFGSSVSFTTPADYVAQKWHTTAFNMAMNGGGPIDFVDTLNYVIQKSPDQKVPSTLLVELLTPGLKVSNPTDTALKLMPYMTSPRQQFVAFGTAADNLVRLSTLSDTIFTLLFVDTNRWQIWVRFTQDGTGVRNETGGYKTAVKNDVPLMKNLLACPSLDSDGKSYIEKLVKMSQEHQFSIVFYRTPVNADFYDIAKLERDRYAKCQGALDNFMKNITKKNPNVFYRNLSTYEKIADQRGTLYTDGHHLKREGAALLLDALDPEISAALAWTKANRK